MEERREVASLQLQVQLQPQCPACPSRSAAVSASLVSGQSQVDSAAASAIIDFSSSSGEVVVVVKECAAVSRCHEMTEALNGHKSKRRGKWRGRETTAERSFKDLDCFLFLDSSHKL